LEAYYTLLMEILWSKQRIVEMYVNIAEMGYGIYGVQSASDIFYKKDAINLTRNETALLAAVLPNPKRFSVKNPSGYVLGRRNWIVRQMYQLGDVKYLEKLK
jgi:monofunctional glycosyltransferase